MTAKTIAVETETASDAVAKALDETGAPLGQVVSSDDDDLFNEMLEQNRKDDRAAVILPDPFDD